MRRYTQSDWAAAHTHTHTTIHLPLLSLLLYLFTYIVVVLQAFLLFRFHGCGNQTRIHFRADPTLCFVFVWIESQRSVGTRVRFDLDLCFFSSVYPCAWLCRSATMQMNDEDFLRFLYLFSPNFLGLFTPTERSRKRKRFQRVEHTRRRNHSNQ